jgi:MFS family permease
MCAAGAYAHAQAMLISAPSIRRRRSLPGGRPFHLLLVSLAVSSCGDWLYNVALLAFVYERTRSGTWVALTTAARVAPIVLLGPLGGVAADRYDRRALLILSDVIRFGLMLALAAVAVASLPIVLAPLLAAMATAAAAVQPTCVAACTPRLVDDSDLQRANALRAAIGQAAVVVGPALGAIVLVASSPSVAILLNALTFVASAVAVAAIPAGPVFAPAKATADRPAGAIADIAAGARALRAAPSAVRLVAADVLCSSVYGILTVTLVLLSRRLGAGDSGYGLLLAAYGIGGVTGASLTGRLTNPAHWRTTLTVALVLVAATLVALGSAPTLTPALVAALFGGAGMVVGEVLSETALPRMLGDEILGRAYGLVVPTSLGGIVVGSLLAGPLVSAVGLEGAFIATGTIVLVTCAMLVRRPLAPGANDRCESLLQ